jgi:hypothetical protein
MNVEIRTPSIHEDCGMEFFHFGILELVPTACSSKLLPPAGLQVPAEGVGRSAGLLGGGATKERRQRRTLRGEKIAAQQKVEIYFLE